MQHIAATKSDLAAIGINSAGTDPQADYESAMQFRDVFDGQRPPSDKSQKGYAEPVKPITRTSEKPKTSKVDSTQSEEKDGHKSADETSPETTVSDNNAEAGSDKAISEQDSHSDELHADEREADEAPIKEEALNEEKDSEDEIHLQADSEIDWLTLVEGSHKQLSEEQELLISDQNVEVASEEPTTPSVELNAESKSDEDPQNTVKQTLHNLISQLEGILEAKLQQKGGTGDAESPDIKALTDSLAMLKSILNKVDGNTDIGGEKQIAELPELESNAIKESDIDFELLSRLLAQGSETYQSKADKPVSDVTELTADVDVEAELAALLALPEKDLKQALEQLVQVIDGQSKEKPLDFSEQVAVLPKENGQPSSHSEQSIVHVDVPVSQEQKRDFVSALTNKLDEIKSQLKQGHTPAIDLKQLVADAAQQAGITPENTTVLTESASDIARALQPTLDLSQQLTTQMLATQQVAAGERTVTRDNIQQLSVEAQRSAQHLAQADKAVNIAQPEGQTQLAEKVRFMVNQNTMQADIRLDPPELGSMKVRINMSGETAAVSFIVQSPQAKDTLDQAVPRLRELLQEGGIELGQSSVQQEQNEDASEQGEGSGQFASNDEDFDEDTAQSTEQRIVNGRLGGIDYFV